MDKKKKNGVIASIAADKDSAANKSATPSKPLSKQAHTKIAPGSASGNNSERSTKAKNTGSANSSTDRDKTPTGKSNAHAPDDAGSKQGPQKKRRKVTHGTALTCYYCCCCMSVCLDAFILSCPAPLPFPTNPKCLSTVQVPVVNLWVTRLLVSFFVR